ncbi:MAG: efflux RND transporter periplasmic adaptor subunit [Actinobacteria bacterium]|nr:efflux RND transporter periplasmic adaptor subunit [Actinomycetota bacterium]
MITKTDIRTLSRLNIKNNKLNKKTKLKVLTILIIAFFVSIVTNISCAPLFGTKVSEEETAIVEVGDLGETISIIGEVVPKNEMDVSFKTTGTVEDVNVKEGDVVRKGDIIATLKNEDLEIALENYEKDLNNAKQRTNQEIKVAQDAVDNADKASHNIWILNQKKSQLYDQQKPPAGATGEERTADKYQDSVNKQSDKISLEKAHDTYWNSVNNLNTIKINSEVEIENLKRTVSEAKRELEDLILTSPIDGTITYLEVKVGQEIEAQTTTQVTITDLSKIHIEADVDEIDIGKLKEGQEVTVVLDTYPDEELTGNIYYISQVGDESTGAVTYEVRFNIKDNKGLKIRALMSATIDIEIEGRKNVLILPNNTITERDNKKFVTLVIKEEKREVEIETGYSDEVNTEILSGLKEGDKVLIQIAE